MKLLLRVFIDIHFMFVILFVSRLNAEESIQMVTALALQLIQCVVKVPKPKIAMNQFMGEEKAPEKNSKGKVCERFYK